MICMIGLKYAKIDYQIKERLGIFGRTWQGTIVGGIPLGSIGML